MNKNNVFIVVLLLAVGGKIHAMKEEVFPFTELPAELQQDALIIMLNNEINNLPPTAKSLDIASGKIRALASVNQFFNSVINEPKFCLKLIKDMAEKFVPTDDKRAAKELNTECAQKRLKLQKSFIAFLLEGEFSMDTFKEFCKEGVDLEWTFFGNTMLSLSVRNMNVKAVRALIEHGVDMNYLYPTLRDSTLLDEVIGMGDNYYFASSPEKRNKLIAMIKTLLAVGANVQELSPAHRESVIFKEALAEMNKK